MPSPKPKDMTTREYAAIHILAGAGGIPGAIDNDGRTVLHVKCGIGGPDDRTFEERAEDAVAQADALLAALEEPESWKGE